MNAGLSITDLKSAAESVVIAFAIAGDDHAFEEIVRRRQQVVRHFMRHLCRNPVMADDLAQQVFLQAWRAIAQLKSPAAFGGWLKKLSVNVWLQHVRKNELLQKNRQSDWNEGDAGFENDQDLSQQEDHGKAIDLADALSQLPPLMRLCVVLSYNDGMSHGEIVGATGLPLGTIKSNIARGTTRLQALLKDYR